MACAFFDCENVPMGALIDKENISKSPTNEKEFITDLAEFFDLLAKFDYEDKQKEMSGVKNNNEI